MEEAMKPDIVKEIIQLCVFVPCFLIIAWAISDFRAYKKELRENREWLDRYLAGKSKTNPTIKRK